MAYLYDEETVDAINIVLTSKTGATTASYNLGRKYYAADAIFSGSPEVFHCLAESPVSRRGFERHMGIRYRTSIRILGKADLNEVGVGFADLRDTYDFDSAVVTLTYFSKPTSTTTTYSAATNTMSVMRVTNYRLDDNGIITLDCLDNWFEDKLLTRRYEDADFDDLEETFDGTVKPQVFGEAGTSHATDILISSPLIYTASGEARIFAGDVPNLDHPVNAFTVFIAPVDRSESRPNENQACEKGFEGSSGRYGAIGADTNNVNMYQVPKIGFTFQTSTGLELGYGVKVRLRSVGTLTAAIGELTINIALALNNQPLSGTLRRVAIDPASLTSSFADYYFVITKDPNGLARYNFSDIYMVWLEWTNTTDTANYPRTSSFASAGTTIYVDATATGGDQRSFTSVGSTSPNIEVYCIGQPASSPQHDGSTAGYAYQRLNWNTSFDLTNPERQFRMWLGMKGFEDDGSGTITGSANSLIKNPAHIAKFILRTHGLGPELASGDIDGSSFTDAATRLTTDGINFGFALDRETMALELLENLAFQSRCCFYFNNQGQPGWKYPTNFTTASTTITDATHGNQLEVMGLAEQPTNTVINELSNLYEIDPIKRDIDPDTIKKTDSDKFKSIVKLNADESSASSASRMALSATSVTKYGKRLSKFNLDYLHDETAAHKVAHYYFDRFNVKQQRLPFSCQRKDLYTKGPFDTFRVESVKLPAASGTGDLKVVNTATELTVYNEGVPLRTISAGFIEGEVVAVVHAGDEIEFEVETMSGFEAS